MRELLLVRPRLAPWTECIKPDVALAVLAIWCAGRVSTQVTLSHERAGKGLAMRGLWFCGALVTES